MDLTNLENALNNGNFKEQVYCSLEGAFETSFLNSAKFRGLTTQSIATTYNNDGVFYKHSQAIVYEILK